MRERGLTIPEIMLIGGTRVALGFGLGLLRPPWLHTAFARQAEALNFSRLANCCCKKI
jgi:hypothetical protein